jgi:hypothetical protein
MAAHATDHHSAEATSGAALLPIFALATVIATIVIAFVVAYPSAIAAIIALATVVGFASGLVALLSRVIGPGAH